MKKLLAILIIAILLFCGCNTPSTSTPSNLISTSVRPDELEITTPDFFFASDNRTTVSERNEWTDAVSERYGVYVTVTVPVVETYLSMLREALNQDLTGIVNVGTYDMLLYCIKNEAILPLDSYLENNSYWNSLPDDVRNLYKIDGHIWAIPSSYYYSMDTRSIRTDWLTSVNMEIPKTLDEFMQYAVAVAENETIDGTAVCSSTDLGELTDILRAFGVYIDASGQLPYAYDPNTDSFTDGLLSANTVEAFEYLRRLYTAGAIDELNFFRTGQDIEELLYKGEYGSSYSNAADGKYGYGLYAAAEKVYEESAYWPSTRENWDLLSSLYSEFVTLSNPADSNPQVITPISSPYVLVNGTDQPSETVNFFVELLFGSYENYLEARIGLQSNYILNSDGSIELKMILDEDESSELGEGVYYSRHQPGLVGEIEGWNNSTSLNIITNDDPIVNAHKQEIATYKAGLLQTSVNSGAVIKKALECSFPQSDSLLANISDISKAFNDFIIDAISGETPISQLLNEYCIKMDEIGAQKVLDEANAAIGKNTSVRY